MKLSEAFREAKQYVPAQRYICFALQYRVGGDVALVAVKIVSSRLACDADLASDGYQRLPCAERWLESKGFDLTPAEITQWRLMWLDMLIAEFEAKGE